MQADRCALWSWRHACGALLFACALPLSAQTYPAKPIRIVVGFAAGGSTDLLARLSASKLNAAWGQPVVVENRSGAGGNIAAELVAKAAPDGYTLLVTPSSFAVNPSLFRRTPYDPVRDFAPVARLTSYMLFLVCHPSLPVRSVKDLIALARARPGAINYSSAGIGTTTHIAGELLGFDTRVQFTHVPFKGTGQQMPALLSGEVALAFGSTTVVPLIQSRRVVLIAVTGATRFPGFPDVPTVGETVPGFEMTSWNAMFATAGTPAQVVRRLSDQLAQSLRQPDALAIFDKQGLQEAVSTPEELAAVVAAEVPRWAQVIKAANIPLQ